MKVMEKPVAEDAYQWHGLSKINHKILDGIVVARDPYGECGNCAFCGEPLETHGWLTNSEDRCTVCPSDYILIDSSGGYHSIPSKQFHEIYEILNPKE